MAQPEFIREFDFLPNLLQHEPRLDDRAFEDLVQECILRIPRYCPEWTNHNPGDPGITLIELYAWLVDQMLRRFNQVPRRNYVAFLELLGIRLRPPEAAQADLTFYLTKVQASAMVIPAGTEVATERTETQSAIVFTTNQDLIIGQPRIKGLFRSHLNQKGVDERLDERSRRSNPWRLPPIFDSNPGVQWTNLRETQLFENFTPEIDDCFYLVLAPDEPPNSATEPTQDARLPNSISGNVLTLTVAGRVAETTGIDPDNPPLRWSIWAGETWKEGILRQRQDDKTKGFSFHELEEQGFNVEGGADITLHLPQDLPIEDFGTGCWGHWIRCVHIQTNDPNNRYRRSPLINSIRVQAIGGTIRASECVRVGEELLGISNGKPNQTFQLQSPVLKRTPNERIEIKLPDADDSETEHWNEVDDFSKSGPNDRHYTIDSQTGIVQFGPLVREPNHLKREIQERSELQSWGKQVRRLPKIVDNLEMPLMSSDSNTIQDPREWQYGKIPPLGAEIYMTTYRVGGGSRGNVRKETLTVLKKAIPYVKRVINYKAAEGGREAESLDQVIIRVPETLRTSKAAITAENYEHIASAHPLVYRAYCPPNNQNKGDTRGIVRLLIVPTVNRTKNPTELDFRPTSAPENSSQTERSFPYGMNPDEHFTLEALEEKEGEKAVRALKEAIAAHSPLGIQVKLDNPEYVGVKVEAEVLVEPRYNSFQAQTTIRNKILATLYQFLNPITGGFEKQGWVLGRAISPSEIVAVLQAIPEVRYASSVKLFSIRKYGEEWIQGEFPELVITPGERGLICSWNRDNSRGNSDETLHSDLEPGHVVHFIEE
ncbi:MAG: putative baseplate assembly protein [Leptolyngbyaceae cyanobacterium bins.302]|nr:putative baseplate assembly protein [Leptolyngbyaceae cyanobacterium bins.302]